MVKINFCFPILESVDMKVFPNVIELYDEKYLFTELTLFLLNDKWCYALFYIFISMLVDNGGK